jgi:hypothetical protein
MIDAMMGRLGLKESCFQRSSPLLAEVRDDLYAAKGNKALISLLSHDSEEVVEQAGYAVGFAQKAGNHIEVLRAFNF